MECFTDLQVILAKGPRKSLHRSSFRMCAADVNTTKCLLLIFFFLLRHEYLPLRESNSENRPCILGALRWFTQYPYLKRGTISSTSFSLFTSSSRTGAHSVPIMPIMNSASLEMSRAPFSASCFIRSRSKTSVIWFLSLVWPGSKKDKRVYKRTQPS